MVFLLIILAAVLVITAFFIYSKKMHYWIAAEIKRSLFKKPAAGYPVHIMFAFVDHFEPGNRGADAAHQRRRVDAWVERYSALAGRHRDSDEVHPQHTFFFPPHYDTDDHLKKLTGLCSAGFGEVEMHLHHDRQEPWPDDEESLRKKILSCMEAFARFGIFCLPDGTRRYGFIHGDWALANSLKNSAHCGINDELTILRETGCYADLTFPVSNEAQPGLVNTIFYAKSSRSAPKGYDKFCEEVSADKKNLFKDGLMMIQGVLGLRWRSRVHRFKPSIEQANIGLNDAPFEGRIDYWVNKHIHVKGRPDWIFVKIHGHGARDADFDVFFGKPAEDMHTCLETKYNDGERYILHYVSAREMYNIIRAAEDGKSGNPNDYRDYEIPRYIYLPARKK